MKVIISLTQDEVDSLRKNQKGQVGFQSLIATLQTKIHGSELELDLNEIERIARYVQYGTGGFQGRLDGIITALNRVDINDELLKKAARGSPTPSSRREGLARGSANGF